MRFPPGLRSLLRVGELPGQIAYAIGAERWIPLLTRRVLCSVRTEEKKIALTFDDGPGAEDTPRLLAKLAAYRVPATFFVIGRNLKRHPEIGRRIFEEGHEVGNHTFNHRSLPFLTRSQIKEELESTQRLIAELLGVRPVFFRPPNGLFTRRVLDTAEALGYRTVIGDVFPLDFARPGHDIIARRVLRRARPGSIIILHNGHVGQNDTDKSQTLEALDRIISSLHEQMYEFVTLSRLVAAGTGQQAT